MVLDKHPSIILVDRELLEISNTSFSDCVLHTLLLAETVSNIVIRDSLFTNNSAESAGLTFLGSTVEMTRVEWNSNQVRSNTASFGWFGEESYLTIDDFLAVNNYGYLGGVLYLELVECTISNSLFQMNSAGGSGGALYLAQEARVSLYNDTVRLSRLSVEVVVLTEETV